MIDYTKELEQIEKDLTRINKEISFCMFQDVLKYSWIPMKKDRLRRKSEIEHILQQEPLYI